MPSSGIATDVESPFGFNVDRRNVDRRVATKLWHSDCQRWIASRATGNGDRAGARWRDERGEGWHERRRYHGAMSPPRTFFSGIDVNRVSDQSSCGRRSVDGGSFDVEVHIGEGKSGILKFLTQANFRLRLSI